MSSFGIVPSSQPAKRAVEDEKMGAKAKIEVVKLSYNLTFKEIELFSLAEMEKTAIKISSYVEGESDPKNILQVLGYIFAVGVKGYEEIWGISVCNKASALFVKFKNVHLVSCNDDDLLNLAKEVADYAATFCEENFLVKVKKHAWFSLHAIKLAKK